MHGGRAGTGVIPITARATASVSNFGELQAAVRNAVERAETVITVTGGITLTQTFAYSLHFSVQSNGSLTLHGLTLDGGIINNGSTALTDCTFRDNFAVNGGRGISSQNVARNAAAAKPANPTRGGLCFHQLVYRRGADIGV